MNVQSRDYTPLQAPTLPGGESATRPGNYHVSPTTGKPIIQIGFWGPDDGPTGQQTPWYNQLAACWTGGGSGKGKRPSFSHCEMRFSNGYVCSIHEYMARAEGSSADVPGRVHCKPRELDRRNYHFVEFVVEHQQHDVMFATALEYAKKRVPFNQAGMRLNFVWPFSWFPLDREETAFFCSELVVTLLHKAQLMPDTQACTTSPNSLWDYLAEKMEGVCISFNRNASAHAILASLVVPPPLQQQTASGSRQLFTIKNIGGALKK